MPAPEYSVIYADPPWRYSFSRSGSRSIEAKYPTMTQPLIEMYLEDALIDVASDAVLYIWGTAPKLPEALDVVKAWGFKYKSGFVWDKGAFGMGYWARGQHEHLLIGTRGKMPPPLPGNRKRSVIRHDRMRHSRKPGIVRRMIEDAHPGAKRIELFATETFEGWDAMGLSPEHGTWYHREDKDAE